jgi:hypothetical protein
MGGGGIGVGVGASFPEDAKMLHPDVMIRIRAKMGRTIERLFENINPSPSYTQDTKHRTLLNVPDAASSESF